MNCSAIPEGPGSVTGAPHLPDGFTGTFISRYVDTGRPAPARGHRRRRAPAAAGAWLAADLVRLAAGDARASAGLPGHRRPTSAGAGCPASPRTAMTPAPWPATWPR